MTQQILLEQIISRLDQIEEYNREILVQTTKTNGSVQQLNGTVYGTEYNEGLLNRVNNYEHIISKVKGVWIAITFIGAMLLSLAGIVATLLI